MILIVQQMFFESKQLVFFIVFIKFKTENNKI
jgi:hypothetical protein